MNFDMMDAGQSVVYFRGRTITTDNGKEKYEAMKLYLNGYAELTQKKVKIKTKEFIDGKEVTYDVDGFEYIITKRRNPIDKLKLMTRQNYYNVLNGGYK